MRKVVSVCFISKPILKLIHLGAFETPGIFRGCCWPDIRARTRSLGIFWVSVNLIRVFNGCSRAALSGTLRRICSSLNVSVAIVANLNKVLRALWHLLVERCLPSDVQVQIVGLAPVVLALRSVHRCLKEHVIHLGAEVCPAEADVETSRDPIDPCMLKITGRGGPVKSERQEPYHLLAVLDLVDDGSST